MTTERDNPKPLSYRGFVFGMRDGRYIGRANDEGHIIVVGGAGSGKSSCIVIPSLRGWQSSAFVIDIKGELYKMTSPYKARNSIKVFDPQNKTAYGYNPYIFIETSDNPAQEAKTIADILIPLPPNTTDTFWINSARNVLIGAILHYYKQLSFINTLIKLQTQKPKETIDTLLNSHEIKARMCVQTFADMEADNKALLSIFAVLSANLLPLIMDDEVVFAFSREKNITPYDLEQGKSVYIKVPEHLLEQWKPLLTLIVKQFIVHFEQRDEGNHRLKSVLFLLDEFPRLGEVPGIKNALATLRSKKITICLVVQSLAQLDDIYTPIGRTSIIDNCFYQAILRVTDYDTREYFSKAFGTYDKPEKTHGKSASTLLPLQGSKSEHTSPRERRIIKPEEFMTLDDVVMITNIGMFRLDKKSIY